MLFVERGADHWLGCRQVYPSTNWSSVRFPFMASTKLTSQLATLVTPTTPSPSLTSRIPGLDPDLIPIRFPYNYLPGQIQTARSEEGKDREPNVGRIPLGRED